MTAARTMRLAVGRMYAWAEKLTQTELSDRKVKRICLEVYQILIHLPGKSCVRSLM